MREKPSPGLSEWEEAYRYLADKTKSDLFPDYEVFKHNVEQWREQYDERREEGKGLSVLRFLNMRLAAYVRLVGPLGPVTVIKPSSPNQEFNRTSETGHIFRRHVGLYRDDNINEIYRKGGMHPRALQSRLGAVCVNLGLAPSGFPGHECIPNEALACWLMVVAPDHWEGFKQKFNIDFDPNRGEFTELRREDRDD